MDKYVTAKEIAEHLGLARSTVYFWAQAGVIPHYKLGGAVRFSVREVTEWMQGQKREGVLDHAV